MQLLWSILLITSLLFFSCSSGESTSRETGSQKSPSNGDGGSSGDGATGGGDNATSLTVSLSAEGGAVTSSASVVVNLSFSSAVSDFEASDIQTSANLSDFSGSGTDHSFRVNLLAQGNYTVDLPAGVASDSNGNLNQAASQLLIDYTPATSTAQVAGQPASYSNGTTLNIDVSGGDLATYQYKVGLKDSTQCDDSSGYSMPIAESTNLTPDISGEGDGEFVVCIIGTDSQGVTQAYADATRFFWTVDTDPPSITGIANDNSGYSQSKTWNWGCSEECTYDYVVDTNSTTNPVGAFGDVTTATHDSGEGRVYLHIRAKDLAGNESPVVHVFADVDAQAPTAPPSMSDASFSNSLTSSPLMSWTGSTDGASGMSHYQYAIGTSAGATDVVDWTTNPDFDVQHNGLSLTDGTTYYGSVRAVDSENNISPATNGDGWTVDATAPTAVSNLDDSDSDGSLSQTPTLTWSAASDATSGVATYQLAIGTTSGGTEILDWTSVGDVTSHMETGLSLSDGVTYYASIRAVDNAGNVGVPVSSAGWVASAPGVSYHYFVESLSEYRGGEIGGLAGANSECLTELTDNDWKGKSSGVTIDASTVKAFLCDSGGCNNLMASTEYSIARAGSATAGGATFTTTATGAGPQDSVDWSITQGYFEAEAQRWTGRAASPSSTEWALTAAADNCTDWTSSDSGVSGVRGRGNTTNDTRWSAGLDTCNNKKQILCIVDDVP